jgi:hypothetical protein
LSIRMRLLHAAIIAGCFLTVTEYGVAQASGTRAIAQTPPATLIIDQLTAAAKRYFRDTAEIPLLQQMEFAVFDPSGRLRKTQKLTREYLFEGYNPRREEATVRLHGGNVSFWSLLRGNKLGKASMNAANWTMTAGVLARADLSSYSLQITPSLDGDGSIVAQLTHKEPCPAFTMNNRELMEWYLPDSVCAAATAFRLDRDLRFQGFAYEGPGLPIKAKIDPLGECTLQGYHSEVEFQFVTIPGGKEPFLLPKRVTTTLKTDKGKVVISSAYELKPPVH